MTPLADPAVEGAMTVTTGGAVTGVWHGASRSRLVYAAMAVSFMTVGVTLVAAVDPGMWQLVVFGAARRRHPGWPGPRVRSWAAPSAGRAALQRARSAARASRRPRAPRRA